MEIFSIIIPMYNAEKTIDRCISSILSQSIHSWEAIIVDDGSIDNSRYICELLSSADPRIKLISQKNAGPSSARNRGLELASGKYIVFVDADDWLDQEYLSQLYTTFEREDVDALFIGYYLERKNAETSICCSSKYGRFNCIEGALLLTNHDMFGYTWIKVFSADAISGVKFRVNMNLFEDEVFTCEALMQCSQIYVLNAPLYHYCVGDENTLTRKTHQDYCIKRDQLFNAWLMLLHNSRVEDVEIVRIANKSYQTCKYYYMEHDIDEESYLQEFKQSSFLSYVDFKDSFLYCLKSGKKRRLKWMKRIYKTKTLISNIFHNDREEQARI